MCDVIELHCIQSIFRHTGTCDRQLLRPIVCGVEGTDYSRIHWVQVLNWVLHAQAMENVRPVAHSANSGSWKSERMQKNRRAGFTPDVVVAHLESLLLRLLDNLGLLSP